MRVPAFSLPAETPAFTCEGRNCGAENFPQLGSKCLISLTCAEPGPILIQSVQLFCGGGAKHEGIYCGDRKGRNRPRDRGFDGGPARGTDGGCMLGRRRRVCG